MRKLILIILSAATLVNLVLLVIALTNNKSILYPDRLIVAISFFVIAGFLRQHILSYNKLADRTR
ncbi:MAG: hypothetical protein EOO48_02965 [Flavobacterium sp.]|nr:MAG: hypothetical protein EOO48_02965 [Flavobacterium sp.]